jgi:predicted RecA/RadA family phage recombinase
MVLAEFYQPGSILDYINSSGSTIAYGQVIIIKDFIAIATEQIIDGATGGAKIDGVWYVAAETGVAFEQGDPLYWDTVNNCLTKTLTAVYAGTAAKAKASAAALAYVKLGRHVVDTDTTVLATLGDVTTLSTTAQNTAVAAINELDAEIGDISTLTTTATDVAAAINEVDADVAAAVTHIASTSTATPGATGTSQDITIQLKDLAGDNIAAVQKIRAYMCTDAAGATPSATGCNGNVTASTGAILAALTAKLDFDIVTDATGAAVINFDNAGGGDVYADRLALVLPNGQLVVSDALAVATA